MTRLIHIQTVIHTTFGLLDDDGNAAPQEPVKVTIGVFSADTFFEAYKAIASSRDEAIGRLAISLENKDDATTKVADGPVAGDRSDL